MGIFRDFPIKQPGSYRAKMVRFGQKWPKSLKWGKSPHFRIPAFSARGVLHQPLAAGPCPHFWGGPWRGGFWTSEEVPGEAPGPLGPGGVRTGDRAPARGVDVKPLPARRSRDPGLRDLDSQAPWGAREGVPRDPVSGIPGSGARPSGPREGLRTPKGAPAPGQPARRGLFYINPSRRGPVPRPGTGRLGPGTARLEVTPGRPGPWGCKYGYLEVMVGVLQVIVLFRSSSP